MSGVKDVEQGAECCMPWDIPAYSSSGSDSRFSSFILFIICHV
jgi:hypothetical protein